MKPLYEILIFKELYCIINLLSILHKAKLFKSIETESHGSNLDCQATQKL